MLAIFCARLLSMLSHQCLCWDLQKLSTPDVPFSRMIVCSVWNASTFLFYETSIHWTKHTLTARGDFSYWRKELKMCQSGWDAVSLHCLIYLEFFPPRILSSSGSARASGAVRNLQMEATVRSSAPLWRLKSCIKKEGCELIFIYSILIRITEGKIMDAGQNAQRAALNYS